MTGADWLIERPLCSPPACIHKVVARVVLSRRVAPPATLLGVPRHRRLASALWMDPAAAVPRHATPKKDRAASFTYHTKKGRVAGDV